MDIERLRHLREPWLVDLDLINTIRQTLESQCPLIIGAEDTPVLVRLADDLNRGFHPETRWICHPQPQLAAVGLGKKKQGTRKEENDYFPHETSASVRLIQQTEFIPIVDYRWR